MRSDAVIVYVTFVVALVVYWHSFGVHFVVHLEKCGCASAPLKQCFQIVYDGIVMI